MVLMKPLQIPNLGLSEEEAEVRFEAPLGARGMGEVYQAADSRLDRTVAHTVLPEHVAADRI